MELRTCLPDIGQHLLNRRRTGVMKGHESGRREARQVCLKVVSSRLVRVVGVDVQVIDNDPVLPKESVACLLGEAIECYDLGVLAGEKALVMAPAAAHLRASIAYFRQDSIYKVRYRWCEAQITLRLPQQARHETASRSQADAGPRTRHCGQRVVDEAATYRLRQCAVPLRVR